MSNMIHSFNVILYPGIAEFWNSSVHYDLSGTKITSDKPIAVFAGNLRASMPNNQPRHDHIVEQLAPTASWGRDHVLIIMAAFGQRQNYFSVSALLDGCTLHMSNGTELTLVAGVSSLPTY